MPDSLMSYSAFLTESLTLGISSLTAVRVSSVAKLVILSIILVLSSISLIFVLKSLF